VIVLAPLPDLIVTALHARLRPKGGDNITVTWTVKNTSTGVSQPTGWIDTVY